MAPAKSRDRSPSSDPAPRQRSRYRSPLREERAADTRRRIATAALELFAEHGFAQTTVAAVAAAAGVSVQTIYATFGSKTAIVRALLEQFEENADADAWSARIAAEPDPRRKLEAFAQWSASIFSTSRRVITAAAGAAGDPAMLELKAEGDRHRREGVRRLISGLAASGTLRPGLSRREATDRAWILTGLEVYLATTDGCGWSDATYATWLAGLLIADLLRLT